MADQSTSKWIELELQLFNSPLVDLTALLRYDRRTMLLWQIVEQRYADSALSLDIVSRACGMSKNNVNVVLKSLIGMTFYRLLSAYRVYASVRTIQSTNYTFTEVAFMTGFDSSSSYSRTVRRMLHTPPRDLLPRGSDYQRHLKLPGQGDKKMTTGSRDEAKEYFNDN